MSATSGAQPTNQPTHLSINHTKQVVLESGKQTAANTTKDTLQID